MIDKTSIYNYLARCKIVFYLFLCALGVSLAFQLIFPTNKYFVDENEYIDLANSLYEDGVFKMNLSVWSSAWRTPGYPVFLYLIFRIFGTNLFIVKIFQSILGAINVLLVYFIARQCSNKPVAITAAFMTAFYPYIIFYHQIVMAETLYTTALLLICLVFTRALNTERKIYYVVSGVLGALCAYIRPGFIAFPVFFFLFVLFFGKRNSVRIIGMFLFLLVFTSLIVPWHIRNHYALCDGKIFSTQGGINFWVGNNPRAIGTQLSPDGLYYPIDEKEGEAVWGMGEVAQYYESMRKGRDYIISNPLKWVKLGFIKLTYLWNIEARDFLCLYGQGKWNDNTVFLVGGILLMSLPFFFLTITCLAGLMASDLLCGRIVLLANFLYVSLMAVVFFGDNRYHLPCIPLMCIYAAYFLHSRACLKGKRGRQVLFAVFLSLFVLSVVHRLCNDITMYQYMIFEPSRFRSN